MVECGCSGYVLGNLVDNGVYNDLFTPDNEVKSMFISMTMSRKYQRATLPIPGATAPISLFLLPKKAKGLRSLLKV